jgi:hypothetical protein
MTQHPDLEALSAYVDGEAPEWAGHVAACASCRATADQLGAVAAAVGAPVEAPDAAVREAAVAAALGDVDQRHAADRARSRGRRSEWPVIVAGMAALFALVLGTVALISDATTSPDQTTVAGPAFESAPQDQALSDSSAAASLPPTDLGDVPDAATLRARALPGVARSSAGAVVGEGAGGSATNPGNTGAAVPPVGGMRSAGPAPHAVGTRPCEEQARAREPALGEVVYYATARRGQVPAVVLGFSTGPAPAPVTLLMLAQDGCGELLRSAGP